MTDHTGMLNPETSDQDPLKLKSGFYWHEDSARPYEVFGVLDARPLFEGSVYHPELGQKLIAVPSGAEVPYSPDLLDGFFYSSEWQSVLGVSGGIPRLVEPDSNLELKSEFWSELVWIGRSALTDFDDGGE